MNAQRVPILGLLARTLVLGLAAAAPTAAQDPAATLDAYVESNRLAWEIPGLAVAVVHKGQVVLAKGYGVRQLGSSGAVDEHTLFSIGSTTKAMTAATLGLSVDAGLLGWHDPVITHWPGFRLHDAYATRELTVIDLLTHRAGLGNADQLWYGRDRPREDILARIPLIEPAYSLRAGFVYQNIMYVAAGELAGRLTDSSWEDLVTSRLFQPLGMERTVPTTTAAERMANVAQPHYRIEGQVEVIQNEILDTIAPAGAVWSSVSDMSRWLRMLLNEGEWNGERILSEATVSEMFRPQTLLDVATLYPYLHLIAPHWTSYGLGWFQLDYHGRAVSFHTGSIDGMAAIVGIIPDEELGVVVLENLDHAELRHALLWKAFDLFGEDESSRDWSAELQEFYAGLRAQADERRETLKAERILDTEPSLPLERYAGTYDHPLYGELLVSFVDGHLRIVLGPRLAADLEHWHRESFRPRFDRRWQDGGSLITFHLDGAGDASRLEMGGLAYRRVDDPEK